MVDKEQYVYVVLTQTGTLISRTIKKFTRAPFNHASITTDKELGEMFSFARLNIKRPLPGGFIHEDISTGVFSLFSHIPCEIYGIRVTEEQLERYNLLLDHFKEHTKLYSYNILGLLTVPLGIPLKRKTRFVCSQFVAFMLEKSGAVEFQKDISLVTPDDFRFLDDAVLLYNGNIKEYSHQKLYPIHNLSI